MAVTLVGLNQLRDTPRLAAAALAAAADVMVMAGYMGQWHNSIPSSRGTPTMIRSGNDAPHGSERRILH